MYKKLLILLVLTTSVACSQGTRRVTDRLGLTDLGFTSRYGDGYIYRADDTLGFEYGGVLYRLILTGATDGQGLLWNAADSIWKPGNLGSAGSPALNELLDPTAHSSYNMGTYAFSLVSSGAAPANPLLELSDGVSGGNSSRATLLLYTVPGNLSLPLKITAQGSSNGVSMSSDGAFGYTGSGTINANLWKGSSTFDKASQHAQTTYYDKLGIFTVAQIINGTATDMFIVINSSGNGVYGQAGTSGAGIYGVTSSGYGLRGLSATGYGLYVNSTSGVPGRFLYASIPILDIRSNTFMPMTIGSYNLGKSDTTFGNAYIDSVLATEGMKIGDNIVASYVLQDSLWLRSDGDSTVFINNTQVLASSVIRVDEISPNIVGKVRATIYPGLGFSFHSNADEYIDWNRILYQIINY